MPVDKCKIRKFYLLIALLLLFAVAIFTLPIDPDLGWHLRSGEIIWEQKTFPDTTPFSYNFTSYKIADFYWLSQVIFYLLWNRFGLWAIPLTCSFLGAGVVLFLLRMSAGKPFVKLSFPEWTSLFFTGFIASFSLRKTLLGGRPMVFGLLFLAILIWISRTVRRRKSWSFLLMPLAFLLWANFYGDFIYGLFFVSCLFLYCVFRESLELLPKKAVSWFKRKITTGVNLEPALGWPRLMLLFVGVLLSYVATLINPYGILLWKSILGDVDSFHLRNIVEWLPPSPASLGSGFGWYVAILTVVLVSIILIKKQLYLFDVLVVVGFILVSSRFVYAFRFLILWSLLPLFLGFTELFRLLETVLDVPRFRKGLNKTFLFMIVALLVLGGVEVYRMTSPKNLAGDTYPYEALEFLGDQGLPGRMFNEYVWGGYLVWQRPEWKLFIYGNMPAWKQGGDSVFRDYINIAKDPENYAHLLDQKYNVDWTLIKSSGVLAEYLRESDDWELVYEDGVSAIFQLRDQRSGLFRVPPALS